MVDYERLKEKLRKNQIAAIFFDWDRTLAYHGDPESTLDERLVWMFHKADLSFTQEEIAAALKQYKQDVQLGKEKQIENPQTKWEIAALYRYILAFLSHEWNWELLNRLYGTYAQLPTALYENSRRTLQAVISLGYKVGIISNHSRSARPVIEQMVGDIIPGHNIILSEEMGVHKPAKTIFLRAANRLQAAPGKCLLVGDNLFVDAIGAVENGGYARGVWLDRKNCCNGQTFPPGVSCISSLVELLDVI